MKNGSEKFQLQKPLTLGGFWPIRAGLALWKGLLRPKWPKSPDFELKKSKC
jgi:hypothetical protein